MGLRTLAHGVLAAAVYFAAGALGQATTTPLTEPVTGITFAVAQFSTTTVPGGLTWGYALPPDAATKDATEYIGYLSAGITATGGWTGFSHSGDMSGGLLLQAWPYNGRILSGFRFVNGYVAPDIYTGNAKLTTLYSSVNATTYEWVYRCQNCWQWAGAVQNSSTSSGFQLLAWAQAEEYPLTPSDPNSNVDQHEYQGNFGGFPASAVNSKYSQWATKTYPPSGTSTGTGSSTTSPVSTTTPAGSSPTVSGLPAPTATYDYIVVGSGAGGIPLADKLSEAGHSVLLIERGPPSTGQWGGTLKPSWLAGTSLTRFDVPGLDNEIWHDSNGIACRDVGVMSGCILGGGTAINAGLWWHPPDQDFNTLFPTGWKASDMAPAISRVFSRIPGTYIPSQDGIDYNPSGYNVMGSGLAAAGWQNVTANSVPNSKNRTFSHAPFMYSGAQRGGPLATYLATANARKNFKLILNTNVRRVVRSAGHITGVEVQAYANGGYTGTINVTASTGRVVLSAGAFGSARILFRSGIGPQDQLQVIKGSALDGASMINSNQWINLPVGYSLDDHVNTDVVFSHPNVSFYDFYQAYDSPIAADRDAYLKKKSGILAKSAPNIGPAFFESIPGKDGINRQLEWTARCEGSLGEANNNTMTASQYLGTGAVSRGRTTIDANMNMIISTTPYLRDDNDIAAVVSGVQNLMDVIKKIPNAKLLQPAPGVTASDYVKNYVGGTSTSARSANHWCGSVKMGTDDGRGIVSGKNGTAVVDLNTKVYGTDNLFVVDASIFPGITTGNPSSTIVSVAEKASEKILALAMPKAAAKYAQCAGKTYSGVQFCEAGSACTYQNPSYSQCL